MSPRTFSTSLKQQPVPSLGIALAVVLLAFEVALVAIDTVKKHAWSAGTQNALSHPSSSECYDSHARHEPAFENLNAEPFAGPFHFAPTFDDQVGMRVDYTSHYQYHTAEGAAEFAALLPRSGHLVYLDPEASSSVSAIPQAYTVTLLHQMKCLDVIRAQYADPTDARLPLTSHCLNYLRQTVLCRPNTRVEPAINSEGTAVRGYDAVCRDWMKVYEEAEKNGEAYRAWTNATASSA